MLKYVSKFLLEMFPSVIATVVGAYIVNYYIIPKAGSDAPKAAVHSGAAPVNNEERRATDITRKPEAASAQDSKGQEAKGQDNKGKAGADKAEKPLEKPVEAAKDIAKETGKSGPETRRSPREKFIAKSAPPVPAPAEAAAPTEERRDANELARAAIERLRTSPESVHQAETPAPVPEVREPAGANVVVAAPPPPQPHPFVQPLPPPVNVTTSTGEGSGAPPASSPYMSAARSADANRPIPPADIPPGSHPLDLQAAAAPPPKPSVADDMLSAARSVINAVVPQ